MIKRIEIEPPRGELFDLEVTFRSLTKKSKQYEREIRQEALDFEKWRKSNLKSKQPRSLEEVESLEEEAKEKANQLIEKTEKRFTELRNIFIFGCERKGLHFEVDETQVKHGYVVFTLNPDRSAPYLEKIFAFLQQLSTTMNSINYETDTVLLNLGQLDSRSGGEKEKLVNYLMPLYLLFVKAQLFIREFKNSI